MHSEREVPSALAVVWRIPIVKAAIPTVVLSTFVPLNAESFRISAVRGTVGA